MESGAVFQASQNKGVFTAGDFFFSKRIAVASCFDSLVCILFPHHCILLGDGWFLSEKVNSA
jgi:hypothetical protein